MGFRKHLLDPIDDSGVTGRSFSLLATGNPETVRTIRDGSMPGLDTDEAPWRILGSRLEVVPLDEPCEPREKLPAVERDPGWSRRLRDEIRQDLVEIFRRTGRSEGCAIVRAGLQHARDMAFALGNFVDGAGVDVSHCNTAEVINAPRTMSDKQEGSLSSRDAFQAGSCRWRSQVVGRSVFSQSGMPATVPFHADTGMNRSRMQAHPMSVWGCNSSSFSDGAAVRAVSSGNSAGHPVFGSSHGQTFSGCVFPAVAHRNSRLGTRLQRVVGRSPNGCRLNHTHPAEGPERPCKEQGVDL